MKRPELQRSSQGLSDMPETVLHAVFRWGRALGTPSRLRIADCSVLQRDA